MWIFRLCRLSIVSQHDYVIDILLVSSTAHWRGMFQDFVSWLEPVRVQDVPG